jgi:hypothetical protein
MRTHLHHMSPYRYPWSLDQFAPLDLNDLSRPPHLPHLDTLDPSAPLAPLAPHVMTQCPTCPANIASNLQPACTTLAPLDPLGNTCPNGNRFAVVK